MRFQYTKLEPGHIVTDHNQESCYYQEQGEVIRVQICFWGPPEVLVRFDRDPQEYYLSDQKWEKTYAVCRPRDLRRNDDWAPQVHARRRFGTRFHVVQTRIGPLNRDEPCLVAECPNHQEERVWINIWGTVMDVYVCAEHARHYRRWSCMDSFPWRPRQSA